MAKHIVHVYTHNIVQSPLSKQHKAPTTRSVPGGTASRTSSYVQMQAHLSAWFCADSPGSVAGRMQMSASKRNVTSANAARVARSILRGSTTARGRPEVSAMPFLCTKLCCALKRSSVVDATLARYVRVSAEQRLTRLLRAFLHRAVQTCLLS